MGLPTKKPVEGCNRQSGSSIFWRAGGTGGGRHLYTHDKDNSQWGIYAPDGLPQRVEYACHVCICTHLQLFLRICICMSTSTHACIAYACRHMHAWHACTYMCMHGIENPKTIFEQIETNIWKFILTIYNIKLYI